MENLNNSTMPKYAILKIFGIISLLSVILLPMLVLMAQAFGIDIAVSNEFMMLNSLAYAIGIVVMMFIVWRSVFTFREIGFRRPENTRGGTYFWVLAAANAIYMLVLWLTAGVRSEITVAFILISIVFTALVGILEELVFRGLI